MDVLSELKKLSTISSQIISGIKNEKIEILDQDELIQI